MKYSAEASNKVSEAELKNFFDNEFEKTKTEWCINVQKANWDFESHLNNKEIEQTMVNLVLKSADYDKKTWEKHFKNLNPNDYNDSDLKRKIMFSKMIGNSALDEEELSSLTNAMTAMTGIYSTAKICPYKNRNCDLKTEGLNLNPEITKIMASSRDYDELSYVWKAWRDQSGAKIRNIYETYVNLSNKAAELNGFKDLSGEWLFPYESPNFIQLIDDLWLKVEPLYSELHKYVAHKLKMRYGDVLDISDGLLPAHILGNMWAQDWSHINEIVKPFPSASKNNVTDALIKKGYTVRKMFETSDDFYKSLGLISNEISYNTEKGAIIEKPTDGKEMVCHPSATDMCDGKNFRIKMCTTVNADDFLIIHHEMGHIEYYQLYKDQPLIYRDGANPGFHEAIGDTIALSVATPKHLHKIGLLDEYVQNHKASINALMSMALLKVAFLPFSLALDKWRWDVFQGVVTKDDWNSHYWMYRTKYQKIKPPVPRSETDFDPGSKYHVPADTQFIQYFVAHILQFQFYKSLCIAAGEYDPMDKAKELHDCDFYQSKAAGDKLRAGLSLGSSKHWSVVMKAITGQELMDAGPLLEYFEPLHKFLKAYNRKHEVSH